MPATTPSVKPIRDKAVCYIVSDGKLLVFRHLDYDLTVTGLQVPAGGIHPGESAADAALREAAEETGLTGLEVVAELGVADYDLTPYRREIQRCHFVQLRLTEPAPQCWESAELGDGTEAPIRFECFWIPLTQAHVLGGGQGMLLGELPEDAAPPGGRIDELAGIESPVEAATVSARATYGVLRPELSHESRTSAV